MSNQWAKFQAALPTGPPLKFPKFLGWSASSAAKRKDLPVAPKSYKASRSKLVRSMLRMKTINKKKMSIEEDFDANSSRASRTSKRKTVLKVMGEGNNVRLNVKRIKELGSAFKEGGYKSGSSYLMEAKLMHVEAGGEWTAQLDRVYKQVMRALNRGRGPKSKAPEIPLEVRQRANYGPQNFKTKVYYPRELFQFGLV